MTENRFTQKDSDDWEIFNNGKHLAFAHSGYQAGKIIEVLNGLYRENQRLNNANSTLNELLAINRAVMKDCDDGEIEIGMRVLSDLYYEVRRENENLKQALWEAEVEYLHEAYRDNSIRLEGKIEWLKEDWDKEYWNDR